MTNKGYIGISFLLSDNAKHTNNNKNQSEFEKHKLMCSAIHLLLEPFCTSRQICGLSNALEFQLFECCLNKFLALEIVPSCPPNLLMRLSTVIEGMGNSLISNIKKMHNQVTPLMPV